MITAHIHDQAARLRSIEIIAQAWEHLGSEGRAEKASSGASENAGARSA
jgi:hypothetical protein